MYKLYQHQQKFLDKNPNVGIIVFEAGTGKTLTAIEWIKLRPNKTVLIIVPKTIKKKWIEDLKKFECKNECDVITKEEFKKENYLGIESKKRDLLIVDEVHNFASPIYISKFRSDLTTNLFNYINKHNPDRLLLSATPVRSVPANLHTILTFGGVDIKWEKWRDYFYTLVRRPYSPRPFYEPIKGWQKKMPPIIEKYCHVARMRDCIDVPVHEYQYIDIELSKKTKDSIKALKSEIWEATKLWYAENRMENGLEKLEWIKDFAEGHPKVVIVCKYREQIDLYKEQLKDREVFVLHGGVKDQGQVIKDAQDSPECYLLIQSQVSAGYDLDSFDIMIFASMDWGYVNKVQMEARINRIHNLHRNQYIYLIGGEKDRAVIERLKMGEDFDISLIREY